MTATATTIELDGLQCLKALSAFQALQMPSKFYGVTHKQARDILQELTGKRPKGKPTSPERGSDALGHYMDWLGAQA